MIRNKITTEERGSEVVVSTQGEQEVTPILLLNEFLRSLPESQRPFFKECRIKGVIPVYQYGGDFKPNETAYTLDADQLDWFFKRHPEYLANDGTKNASTVTGRKIIQTPEAS